MMGETKSIAVALAKAQMSMKRASKDSTNPHFKSKYADLASVMDACVPALNENGIAVFQPLVSGDFGHAVKTVLLHDSGESLECAIPLLLSKQDMQGLGAAITYARRYGLSTMAGIAPLDESDDDGESARKTGMPSMGSAIGDAWRDSVTDNLPPNATPRQTAEAFARAICDDFKGKGMKALDNRWEKHKKIINQLSDRFPDLYEKVIDAYEMRKNDILPDGG